MFPARAFAPRYFGPRYFPSVGAAADYKITFRWSANGTGKNAEWRIQDVDSGATICSGSRAAPFTNQNECVLRTLTNLVDCKAWEWQARYDAVDGAATIILHSMVWLEGTE